MGDLTISPGTIRTQEFGARLLNYDLVLCKNCTELFEFSMVLKIFIGHKLIKCKVP